MKPEMSWQPEKLVGKYFHSVNETDKIEWHGVVIGESHPGWYLAQLFEWTSGEPTVQRLVPIEKMISFFLSRCGEDDVWLKTSTTLNHITQTSRMRNALPLSMTADEYEVLCPDEKEHFFLRPKCGQLVDKRDLRDVIFNEPDHKPNPRIPRIRGKRLQRRRRNESSTIL
jgi:hypothetical protein